MKGEREGGWRLRKGKRKGKGKEQEKEREKEGKDNGKGKMNRTLVPQPLRKNIFILE